MVKIRIWLPYLKLGLDDFLFLFVFVSLFVALSFFFTFRSSASTSSLLGKDFQALESKIACYEKECPLLISRRHKTLVLFVFLAQAELNYSDEIPAVQVEPYEIQDHGSGKLECLLIVFTDHASSDDTLDEQKDGHEMGAFQAKKALLGRRVRCGRLHSFEISIERLHVFWVPRNVLSQCVTYLIWNLAVESVKHLSS